MFVTNAPYDGGTHLPDITVVAPVFVGGAAALLRGRARAPCRYRRHLARLHAALLQRHRRGRNAVRRHRHDRAAGISTRRRCAPCWRPARIPARNPEQNIADLKAQAAACAKGAAELRAHLRAIWRRCRHRLYAPCAGQCRRRGAQGDRRAEGRRIRHADGWRRGDPCRRSPSTARHARPGWTSPAPARSSPNNLNAPGSVTKAAVLYVFRCLVEGDIPMNAGCLKPLEIVVPEGSMLNPRPPGRGGRRQCGDQPGGGGCAVRRAGRDGGGAGHDEQSHLRQCSATNITKRSAAAPARGAISTANRPCTPT